MNEEGKLIRIFPALSGRDLTVEDMDLDIAVRNALKRSGLHTLAQLLQLSHPELLAVFPNRKLRSYEEVIHRLVCLSEEEAPNPGFAEKEDISSLLVGGGMSGKKFSFNIFQVAGIWKSEEIHTSVIAELINPKSGFHDKGAVFLDKFLLWIGKPLLSPEEQEEFKNAEVKTEVLTNEGRRIDMVISTKSFYLPFEAKIWAGDQDAQLWDYYEFAKKQGKDVPKVYYLTPDGHKPSAQSRKKLRDDQICLLSFKGHILRWLEDCMKEPDIPSDVLEIMKQLRDNIQGGPAPQTRPGIAGKPGFSPWNGKSDVLYEVYQKLSSVYRLPWTECGGDYMTFTLHKEKFEKASLEFALRIKKEGQNQMRLYLICGLTGGDGKTDYDSAGDYISKNPSAFKKLLENTFQDSGKALEIKPDPIKSAWNRLPERDCYRKLNTDGCCGEIERIVKALQPRPGQELRKSKNS